MLSEAKFVQLVELPGVGPIRAHPFFAIEGGSGGGSYRVFATQHWGSRLGGLG